MPPTNNSHTHKIATACELTDLLEQMHIHKHAKGKNLGEAEIIQIRREWYLDRTKISLGDADGVPSKRKIN